MVLPSTLRCFSLSSIRVRLVLWSDRAPSVSSSLPIFPHTGISSHKALANFIPSQHLPLQRPGLIHCGVLLVVFFICFSLFVFVFLWAISRVPSPKDPCWSLSLRREENSRIPCMASLGTKPRGALISNGRRQSSCRLGNELCWFLGE